MSTDRKKIGPYEIQDIIGSGGMGVVYRAVQPALKRYVAIKVLPANLAQNKEFVERFLREARSVAALDHPGIIPIYDIGESEGAYYFVMKYLVGDTLEEYIEEEGRVPLDKALLFAGQLAEALSAAHESGVIHRDVKPANIIVDPREQKVVLTDFGIALTLEETRLTRPGTMFGSPIYIAPEQLEGGDVDHRADFYSLGSVLYQMLAGCPPYEAEIPVAILHQRIREPEKSVRDINPEVPEAVDQLVQRLMARNPDHRYQSAAEVVEALRQVREHPEELLPAMAVDSPEEAPADDPADDIVSPLLPVPVAEPPAPRPAAGERFGVRRIILAWIGVMAILLLVLLVTIWCTRNPDPVSTEESRQAQLPAPGDETAATIDENTGESTVAPDEQEAAEEPERSADPTAAEKESTIAVVEEEPPAKEEAVRPTEVGPSEPVEKTDDTPPPVRPPARTPEKPVVSDEEVAEAVLAARGARDAAIDAGASEHAAELWNGGEEKLLEAQEHRAAKCPEKEIQACAEARALYVRAIQKADAEAARQESAGEEELAGLETRIERGISAGSMAGLEDAGQALERFREIAPEDVRLDSLSSRFDDARLRLWQTHGMTRSFGIAQGVEMEFVWVPPGTFRMGTVSKKKGTHSDEAPKHTVVIGKGFWLGKFEVTQAQWQAVMGSNPSRFKGDDRPVDRVSWNDARAFIDKLNSTGMDGQFRLPTEAEWEFTCRAGTGRSFFGGEINTMGCDNEDHLAPWAWYCYNSGDNTHPVGLKKPNAWGFHDMHGNVGEWCSDYYDQNYYEYSPIRNPGGPDTGKTRVLRGGGWDFRAWDCRSAYRGNYRPGANNNSFGIRIVRLAD